MLKKVLFFVCALFFSLNVYAKTSDFDKYFKVDMKMELPDFKEYIKKIMSTNNLYDKKYRSRMDMGKKFNKEFSQTIKFYGLSEGRLKNNYEDDLLEVLSWMPKETYQYIGPMLHQVPGMSEKILNLPGIKETKDKFPEKVADTMKAIEDIEFLSPALYFLLMPEIWEDNEDVVLDEPEEILVKKPRVEIELPDFMKEKIGLPVAKPKPVKASKSKKIVTGRNLRTVSPNLVSPLTTKDAEAFITTIDEIVDWGEKDNYKVYSQIILSEHVLDMWEQENGTALHQNTLKDVVNPCQRMVIKIRLAGLYNEFRGILAKHGYTPEEWAYVGDKTIKAFRVAYSTPEIANAVKYHRRGYYDEYIERLPEKWKKEMYANGATIIKMYSVFKEDVEAVKPLKETINEKFVKNKGVILSSPIIY